MDKDLARCLRMRSLTVSTTNGQTSLLEDCKAVEELLNTACRNYAPHAVEVDPVIGMQHRISFSYRFRQTFQYYHCVRRYGNNRGPYISDSTIFDHLFIAFHSKISISCCQSNVYQKI